MSIPHKDTQLYAASCNPSRRAKRPRSESIPESTPQSAHPDSRLPSSLPKLQPRGHDNGNNITSSVVSSQPAGGDISIPVASEGVPRRGRKTTSRAAREAQRKLNHSMIEKVRRTKINDALAMLRSLVPVDYGQHNTIRGDDDDDDESTTKGPTEEDRDTIDETCTGRKKPKRNKKDDKEKEYKLEILVRTVAFVQDLVEKVRVMEAERASAKHRGSIRSSSPSEKMQIDNDRSSPTSDHPDVGRLPSISSWLPPSAFHPPPSSRYPDRNVYHLPSPPSSTLVDPVKTTQIPPILTLDLPSSSSSHKSTSTFGSRAPPHTSSEKYFPISPRRTPEDESAASLLLQISNSPPSLPLTHHTTVLPSSPAIELPKSAAPGSNSISRRLPFKSHSGLQAQTPSSLLGLDRAQRRET